MADRLVPRTPEVEARDDELRQRVAEAASAYAALSPVDQALHYVAQRNSFARGNLALDGAAVPETFADPASVLAAEVLRLRRLIGPAATATCAYVYGDSVEKIRGAEWSGRVVGVYSTDLTPIGYAVESDAHENTVQIYPEAALQRRAAGAGPRMIAAERERIAAAIDRLMTDESGPDYGLASEEERAEIRARNRALGEALRAVSGEGNSP